MKTKTQANSKETSSVPASSSTPQGGFHPFDQLAHRDLIAGEDFRQKSKVNNNKLKENFQELKRTTMEAEWMNRSQYSQRNHDPSGGSAKLKLTLKGGLRALDRESASSIGGRTPLPVPPTKLLPRNQVNIDRIGGEHHILKQLLLGKK